MIQEAHVGVGVSGKEGRQAVNASDFAIAQFRFLERLLLVHGRWDYRRTCKFILYTFWRNAIITMLLFYYTFFSGYSGTCMFTSTVWTSFSMILFWPIIATGISDRDVTAKQAVEHPSLYATGRLGLDLNITKMVEMLLSAFVHSFVIMTIAVVAVMDLDVAATGSYYSFGFMVFSWVVLTMNYRATFITTTYNFVFLAALAVSFLTYLLFACVYCSLPSMFPEVRLGRQLGESFLNCQACCCEVMLHLMVLVRYGSSWRNPGMWDHKRNSSAGKPEVWNFPARGSESGLLDGKSRSTAACRDDRHVQGILTISRVLSTR